MTREEQMDIVYYNGLLDIASGKIQKLNEELIPSYIIVESLSYFSSKEKYEDCSIIKKYFDQNPEYIAKATKEEWFGLVEVS